MKYGLHHCKQEKAKNCRTNGRGKKKVFPAQSRNGASVGPPQKWNDQRNQ